MRCTTAREHVRAWTVGDRSPRNLARALAHLARCAQCRAELRHIKQLRLAARELPAPSIPAELRARLLADIAAAPIPASVPAAADDANQRRRSQMVQRTLIAGAVLATAIGGLVMVSSHSPRHGGVLAMGNVRKALEHVNTWHLKGWQRQGDTEVPWEVWGRRAPFFYHERIGDQETFDDGKSRTLVFPPDKFYLTKRAVVLKIPSRPDAASSMGLAYVLGLDRQPDNQDVKPWSKDDETVTYRREESVSISNPATQVNGLLTFQQDSPLPIRYERLIRNYHVEKDAQGSLQLNNLPESAVIKQWTGVHLDAQYDIEPDPAALHIAAPADALEIDAVRDAAAPTMPTHNAITQNGLTVHVAQGFMDWHGDVLLRLEMFVGSVGCKNAALPFSCGTGVCAGDIKDEQGRWQPSGYPDSLVARDERGRYYVAVTSFEFVGRDHWLAFAPLEPIKPGEALPRQITFLLDTSLYTEALLSTIDLGGGRITHAMTNTDLMRERLNMNVELAFTPHRIDVLDLSRRYGNPGDIANGFATDYTAAAAEARADAWIQVAQDALTHALNDARIAAERKGLDDRRNVRAAGGHGAPAQAGGTIKVSLHLDPATERETRRLLRRASHFAAEAAHLSPRSAKRLTFNLESLRRYFNSEHDFTQAIRTH